jgi:hypothetical protein
MHQKYLQVCTGAPVHQDRRTRDGRASRFQVRQ